MINITGKAIEKIKEFANEEGLPLSVRIKLLGGGCSGSTLDMMFDDITSELDEIFEVDDIKVVIDQLSLSYIGEPTIDFIDMIYGSGFKIISPMQKTSCGCGSSISF